VIGLLYRIYELTLIKGREDEQVWIVLSRDLFRTVRRAVARLPSSGAEDEEAIIFLMMVIVDAFRICI
jgi:hypothetical protein